mgnify:CR=1 FL=1
MISISTTTMKNSVQRNGRIVDLNDVDNNVLESDEIDVPAPNAPIVSDDSIEAKDNMADA